MFSIFFKPCKNKFREYNLDSIVEDTLAKYDIKCQKKLNKFNQVKRMSYIRDESDIKSDGYSFITFEYDKNDMAVLVGDYVALDDIFLLFDFENSLFNEFNSAVLPKFNVELDYDKIREDITNGFYNRSEMPTEIGKYTFDNLEVLFMISTSKNCDDNDITMLHYAIQFL